MTSWAMHQSDLNMLEARLIDLRPKVSVECGSGLSTPIMWRWSDCVTLEHDERWARQTLKLLTGLKGTLRPCYIVHTHHGRWYGTTLPDQIDFALIDGPPMLIGRGAGLPNLWNHLSENFEVWLDDSQRDHEKQILKDWKQRYPIKVDRLSSNISRITRRAT